MHTVLDVKTDGAVSKDKPFEERLTRATVLLMITVSRSLKRMRLNKATHGKRQMVST